MQVDNIIKSKCTAAFIAFKYRNKEKNITVRMKSFPDGVQVILNMTHLRADVSPEVCLKLLEIDVFKRLPLSRSCHRHVNQTYDRLHKKLH